MHHVCTTHFDLGVRENDFDADADMAAVENASKVTEDQLRRFLEICWVKYVKAKIEPGITDSSHLCHR